MRDRLSSARSGVLWVSSRALDNARRSVWTPWVLSVVMLMYMWSLTKIEYPERIVSSESMMREQFADRNEWSSGKVMIGNRFCILQPVLSKRDQVWNKTTVLEHTGLRLFLDSFLRSVDMRDRENLRFRLYYGHDADDLVFGNDELLRLYVCAAQTRANLAKVALEMRFVPLFDLHGRITAIWNELAAVAYRDGCDFFFMSNDDMIIHTHGWASKSVDHLTHQRGSPRCKHFGIVRFKDDWAKWATFTFHVSTRMHMSVFKGVYYAIPFKTTHNDYWIYKIYNRWHADHYDGNIKVRNRAVTDHSKAVAEPRYEYDSKEGIVDWIEDGSTRIEGWITAHHHALVPAVCNSSGSIHRPPPRTKKKKK